MKRSLIIRTVLLIVLAAAALIDFTKLRVSDDIRVFFPPAKTAQDALFLGLLQRNATDHHILAAISGGSERQRLDASRALASSLRASDIFSKVLNGPTVGSLEDPTLFAHRYPLSRPGLATRFSKEGLTSELNERLSELQSPVGAINRDWLTRDPTGEFLRISAHLAEGAARPTQSGLWVSPDHDRSLLILQLSDEKPSFEMVQNAEAEIRSSFARIKTDTRLTLSGAPILASEARRIVQGDARKLSTIGTMVVLIFLLIVFRFPRDVLMLGIPLFGGVIVAIATTCLVFGSIHGITISFGVTLIGVAIDYPVHVFSHRGFKTAIWPTMMLGVVSTLIAFGALFLSSLTGLKQLGLFGISGLLTAALVTRWLLPTSGIPSTLRFIKSGFISFIEKTLPARATMIAGSILAGAAISLLLAKGLPAFDLDFGSLNPLPENIRKQAAQLQHDIGKPDSGQLLGVTGPDIEKVLMREERLKHQLDRLVSSGALGAYEMAADFLPSRQAQMNKRRTLPDQASLEQILAGALKTTPFKSQAFQPFLQDIKQARTSSPLTMGDLEGGILYQRAMSLLIDYAQGKAGLISLSPPVNPEAMQQLASQNHDVWYIPLRTTAGKLLQSEIHHTITVLAVGFLVIFLIVSTRLRSIPAGIKVIAAPLAALILILAFFQLFQTPLNLFHLVSLLLIFGLGLDYSLFFHFSTTHGGSRRNTLVSLLISAATTIMVFGVLAISATPALHAIGITVSFGALFSLIFSALFSGNRM